MNILHCVYSLLPGDYHGGIPKIVFELSQEQAAQGHTVAIYTTNYNGDISWPLSESPLKITYGLVNIYYFDAFRHTVLFSPSMQRYLLQHARCFDVLHTHNVFHPLNQYVRQAARKHHIPVFYHTHGSLDPSVLYQGLIRSAKKWVYLKAIELPGLAHSGGIFVHNEQEYDQLLRWNPSLPLFMIANGIEIKKSRQTPGMSREYFQITTMSRIHPKKRIHVLIEAVGILKQHFPNIHLRIIGDHQQYPSYTSKLRHLIDRYQLEDRVLLCGHLAESEKYVPLSETSLFCQMSISEGMSIAILEAMGMGIPCLVSQGCYMSHAARDGALAECEGSDPFEVSEMLIALLQNQQTRQNLGLRARNFIERYHHWPTISKSILEVYTHHSKV